MWISTGGHSLTRLIIYNASTTGERRKGMSEKLRRVIYEQGFDRLEGSVFADDRTVEILGNARSDQDAQAIYLEGVGEIKATFEFLREALKWLEAQEDD